MQLLQSYLRKSTAFKSFSENRKNKIAAEGLDGFPLFLYERMIANKVKGRTFVICPTDEVAKNLFMNSALYPEDKVFFLPGSKRGPYDNFSETSSQDNLQLRVLGDIALCSKCLVFTSLRSVCLKLPLEKDILHKTIRIKVGDSLDTMSFASSLAEGSYFRSENTTMCGEFTVRGEVFDLFPYGASEPVRIFMDWDRVERIVSFDPLSQSLSNKELGSLDISLVSSSKDELSFECGGISSYFSDDDYYFFVGDARLSSSFESIKEEAQASFRSLYSPDNIIPYPEDVLWNFASFYEKQNSASCVIVDIRNQRTDTHKFQIDGPRSYFGNFTLLENDLKGFEKNGYVVHIYCASDSQKSRLETLLVKYPFVKVFKGELSAGFTVPSEKFAVLTDFEIFGRRRQIVKTLLHTKSSVIDNFIELKEGDYVVHVNYGVGVFVKLDRVHDRDYLKIRFADKETLFVPIEQANLVQRYIGSAGEAPSLDRLGTSGWENKKAKARLSAEKLAKELIALYAKRANSQGFAFDKDNDLSLKFEASFEFEETPDQISCINDIKHDMESPHVMDRLICGDVGYGKTEVAFRAVFKAVMSGKQVAFLAPTTILAEQHYRTFLSRLGNIPVKCALLSRMVSSAAQKKTLEALKCGSVDVLFGTHRIIQPDIVFSDLALLVVDEEQRFGVKDKERIKQLKANIDCLSLSATPIPRTLYMSLLKIRDMSVLATAPVVRKSINTVVEAFDLNTVIKAVKFEVSRGGQVYYLHNRIESLDSTAALLADSMPDISIRTAHGQMKPNELENVMHDFIYNRFNVLVSTTIIENGIDIPNVNTIIIDRSDLYGISQLYQLRGRVGRSDRTSFAYLFYPAGMPLSEDAVKRLSVISENSDLGSGFKVAMKDMEIRGAGNILGKEQSGFMSIVGLDMYIRLLDEEIAKIQKTTVLDNREVFLDLDYSGYIPDSYISNPSVKLEIYKKIAAVKNSDMLEKLTCEIRDRFGSIPDEVANLLYICELKIICKSLEIYRLKESKGKITVEFSRVAAVNPSKVIDMLKTGMGSVSIDPKRPNCLNMTTSAVSLKDKALFTLEKLQRLI